MTDTPTRRSGHSKLVYDKARRTIVSEATGEPVFGQTDTPSPRPTAARDGLVAPQAPEYYELVPVFPAPPDSFVIANASVGICCLCGRPVTGMGGSNNQICVPCAGVVMSGQARTAIVWEDDGK